MINLNNVATFSQTITVKDTQGRQVCVASLSGSIDPEKSMDIHYRIRDGRLAAENREEIANVLQSFVEKVLSDAAQAGLPV